ncbi:site-specific integrase [Rhizobium sp. KVB221]|uniref:Site-specific integrase n=1 Tax=Rhizobium setariae TaxID=2801340 RepID=A0A936YME7_9HYPH|nr:site-specific integrase [Rhizobium setariae]MBL0370886.1 site-specific integrase [Rhizobium setariae]
MGAVQYVFKRGAVYWWRRRLPNGTEFRALVSTEISLNTKNLDEAKRIAAELTVTSEKIIPLLRDKMISEDHARQILKKVALAHSAKLDAVAANEIAYGADVESSRRADVASGWAYRLFAAHGKNANVGEHELRAMRSSGLDDDTISQVQQTIVTLRRKGAFSPAPDKILTLMEEFGITPTNGHFQHAQQLYLRGMAAALIDTERRWTGVRFDDDALLQQAYLDRASSPVPSNSKSTKQPVGLLSASPNELPAPQPIMDMSDRVDVKMTLDQVKTFDDDIEEEDDDAVDEDFRSLVEIVAEAAEINLVMKEWRKDTFDQHNSLARLFVRFVGHGNPRKMRQTHIAQFRAALVKFPKNYGKSPKDFARTIPEILARAAEMPKEKVGLSASTMNRHMTQMGNIVKICEAAGYPFADFEGVERLRTRKRGSARKERPAFETAELQTLCSLPIWHGCKNEEKRLLAGNLVIHDATYWGPLLAMYTGSRREEFCGLLLSEVETFEGVHCLRLENSAIRDLKTEESQRRVPLHTELIRLGFLDYVEALRSAGHIYLFPELKAAAEGTPMGDVFSDEWEKMRSAALPNAKAEGKVLHSIRHWCNNAMKQAGVSLEVRRDIIGHSNGDDVNAGRYSDPASLELMALSLTTLPTPTSHLTPFPVRLSEAVTNHIPRQSRKRKGS